MAIKKSDIYNVLSVIICIKLFIQEPNLLGNTDIGSFKIFGKIRVFVFAGRNENVVQLRV